MTLGGLAKLAIPVSDMVRASAFYDQLLGYMSFKVLDRSKDCVTWKAADGFQFSIVPTEIAPPPLQISFLADARHEVDELHDLLDGMATDDIAPPEETRDRGNMVYALSFEDPDGHRIDFAHIPAFDLPDDTQDVPELHTPEARVAHTYARALVHNDLATIENLLAEDAVYSAQNALGMTLGRKNVIEQIQLEGEELSLGMADFKARLGLMALGETEEETHPCTILSINARRSAVVIFSLTDEHMIKSITVFTDKKLMKRATAF